MGKGEGGQSVFAENLTNNDHIRTCFVHGGGVMPARRVGSGVGKYNDQVALGPKQGSKRFNSI